MLNWASRFSIIVFLDSNGYSPAGSRYECLLAADAASSVSGSSGDLLSAVDEWHLLHRDWLFGHICYDYKNLLEVKLNSAHTSRNQFPLLSFFCPRTVCYISNNSRALTIECLEADPVDVFKEILLSPQHVKADMPSLQFSRKIQHKEYLDTIVNLKAHIADGDCYEINFCTEGYCEDAIIEPLAAYQKLNKLSPAPFAAYYRLGEQYMICASPERYIQKQGSRIISQPIKGTARRDADPVIDEGIKDHLYNSIKERAENVMIVDLVRNDLARSCEVGTIKVEELFGIYSFPQVHQMISTVSGILREDISLTHPIRFSFPMGSMTGAPKYRVMQLIEHYEKSRRELYSGTIGYITPSGDFDLNVVIRSLFYNAAARYLSYQTGGAITYDSDPQQEWEEMRLKAWALERVFH